MARDILTDAQVEEEIDRLQQSEYVKLSRREHDVLQKRRNYMYQLRWHEKHGKKLMAEGKDFDYFNELSKQVEEAPAYDDYGC